MHHYQQICRRLLTSRKNFLDTKENMTTKMRLNVSEVIRQVMADKEQQVHSSLIQQQLQQLYMMGLYQEKKILILNRLKQSPNRLRKVWKKQKQKAGWKELGRQSKKHLKKSQNFLSNVISPNIKNGRAPEKSGAFR